MGRLILAAVLSVTVIPMTSAQGDISFLHSVGFYKERTAQSQIGYTESDPISLDTELA